MAQKSKDRRAKKAPGRTPLFKPAEVISALEASAGIVAAAARMLRCGRTTVVGYIERHAEVAAALIEIEEGRADIAETALLKMMTNDKQPALQLNACIFYLRTKGRRRGYVMSNEITGKDGGPIETNNKQTLDLSNLSEEELAVLEQAAMVGLAKANASRAH